ncbi:hypothetical protein E1264_00835 [Actinomadura sp. KC216]|uniref:hypothetical protein n=1 Tax=Actinomadura sp. KC216 TaxID=2530370 RepID=UPI0010532F48|nr:hypothetical protein [Actinomadura sp. KC216]TDB91684.1 hypothetical protein E1264_00835 [Actinomadura sp. KC216]
MSQPPGEPPPAAVPPPQPIPPQPPPQGRGPRPVAVVVIAAVAAVVVAVLAVTAVAILVLGEDDESSKPLSSGPVDLREPLTFRLVAQESPPPCTGGALAPPDKSNCYQFGPEALTVRRLEKVAAVPPDPARGAAGWSVALTLAPGDASGFAALTGKAAQAFQSRLPAGNMGMIVGGALVSSPAQVTAPITGSEVSIDGPPETFTQAHVEGIVRRLIGR